MAIRRSRFHHILAGMARTLTICPPGGDPRGFKVSHKVYRPRDFADERADARAMSADWRRVGGDIESAMNQVKAQEGRQNADD